MATSNSVDYNRTRTQIVQGALRLCGVLATGETPEASESADAAEALNLMVKAWQARGIHLWAIQEATLVPQNDQVQYSLGPSGDHATESLAETTLSAAASETDTTITVTSVAGIADTYTIGIELDSGTIQWTTVNGAPAGSVVTLTDALTGDAAASKKVYCYQTKVDRPLRVLSARRVVSGIETDLQMISRQEYFAQPNKTTESTVTTFYYDPQLTRGQLYLWPEPSDPTNLIKFTYARPLEDFDSVSNNPDFPQEWLEALKYNLAVRIAPEYGVPMDRFQILKSEANEYLNIVETWDLEPENVYFGVDYGY